MKERVRGMVLSAATIGEYDKRIVLLTKEWGRFSAFARGARRPKSPLSASTEPFTFGEFYVYRGRDSYSVEQVEVKNYFPELRQDLEKLYMGLYFCEVADYFTREGMTAKDELNLLYLSLCALSVPEIPIELVRYIFEFRMLGIEGEAPRIFECARCGGKENLHHFYVGEAGVVCDSCYNSHSSTGVVNQSAGTGGNRGGITISETTVYTLQHILSSSMENLYTFTVKEHILKEVASVVRHYFDAHTDKKFRSLEMLLLFYS